MSGNHTSGAPSPAIPVSWAETITADVTKIKKSHTDELRAALTALDGHIHGFPRDSYPTLNSGPELPDTTVSYVDTITADVTRIRAQHTNELITLLKAFVNHYHHLTNYDGATGTTGQDVSKDSTVYNPTLTFTDDPIIADSIKIKAIAYNELRTYLASFATHTHVACCECECQCTCTCQCQSDCGCTCDCTCTCKQT